MSALLYLGGISVVLAAFHAASLIGWVVQLLLLGDVQPHHNLKSTTITMPSLACQGCHIDKLLAIMELADSGL